MIHHISSPFFDPKDGLDLFVFGDLQQTPKEEGAPKNGGGFCREAWGQFQK